MHFTSLTWKHTNCWKTVLNGDFKNEISPCQHLDSNPRPSNPCHLVAAYLSLVGFLLSRQAGPKLVASTLRDQAAVASKLHWHRPELSQVVYIQLISRPFSWLTSSRNGARLWTFKIYACLGINLTANTCFKVLLTLTLWAKKFLEKRFHWEVSS